MIAPEESLSGRVEYSVIIDDRVLLCVTMWDSARPRLSARGTIDGDLGRVEVRTSWLDLQGEEGNPPVSLAVVRLGRPIPADGVSGRLTMRGRGRGVRLDPPDLKATLTDIRTLLRAFVTARRATTRERVMEFLVSACAGPSEPGPRLAATLHLIREALRERRRVSVIARDASQALYIESLFRVDSRGYYVRGWMRDPAGVLRVTAVSPEGMRTEIVDRLFPYPGSDLQGSQDETSTSVEDNGFLCLYETPQPSVLSDGWVFEMQSHRGSVVEYAAPPVVHEDVAARDAILGDMARESPRMDTPFAQDAVHAISRLQQRYMDGVSILKVQQFGVPPSRPDVSIIIPLYRRVHLLEQQLAQFVHDAALRHTDLVYVLDSPERADDLLRLASWLWPLYRVPFRVAILDRNSGFAAANNMGARLAGGRLLLLMHSDVLPDAPGWLTHMQGFHDRTPGVGVLGPKLLDEDGSIEGAGLLFHLDKLSQTWRREHHHKGLEDSMPAINRPREVLAVAGACMMIRSQLYDLIGGLSDAYIQVGYEDADLCLRLWERGLGSWYVPSSTLYHLEDESCAVGMSQLTRGYNEWLFNRRWGTAIPRLMATRLSGDPALQGGDLERRNRSSW